ncbi:MAG: UDP-4-amino-4,6-dideoxy-N-acetyl-beta-L-altrosamine transaminase [Kiritimatiellae bacterium]|nr:UDP-4-amino-4,6-dideoxy-N-acetyl-beta-L-altrosamine transaminase [Kiritimatiellia bacterium]
MTKTPFTYGRQSLDAADVEAVKEALESGFLTSGPRVAAFEEALCKATGAPYAVAVSSGTAALHLAMRVAGVGAGDRVVTSPMTFLASANAAEYVGATVDFVDVDSSTANLNPAELERTWDNATRAVVAVDYAGQPCDIAGIAGVARRRGALVIEDACHALGSEITVDGRRYRVGGHGRADLTTFSFHPVKNITTGEGGAVVTHDKALADRCRLLRSHGMTKDVAGFKGLGRPEFNEFGPWYYEMQDLGYNYRLSDILCALGISQLKRLPDFVRRRRAIVAAYNEGLKDVPRVEGPWESPGVASAWHLYAARVDFSGLGKTRTRVMAELLERGIAAHVLYIPVHLQPYYREKYGYGPGKCPVAEQFYRQCLCLPLYVDLEDGDVQAVIEAVKQVAGAR